MRQNSVTIPSRNYQTLARFDEPVKMQLLPTEGACWRARLLVPVGARNSTEGIRPTRLYRMPIASVSAEQAGCNQTHPCERDTTLPPVCTESARVLVTGCFFHLGCTQRPLPNAKSTSDPKGFLQKMKTALHWPSAAGRGVNILTWPLLSVPSPSLLTEGRRDRFSDWKQD